MAPPPPDVPQDEDAFMADVETFYNQRGVGWERNPTILHKPIPLFKLFNIVMDNGGYDVISSERMRWRSLVKNFGFASGAEPAATFALKTVYYKNLAAYEIAKWWHETPPPPEIVEYLTAKGGNLRSRRLEDFQGRDGDGVDGIGVDEPPSTPNQESVEQDEPGSATRYPKRQLRQDPKQTQVFQPDTSSSRQLRYPRVTTSPQPVVIPPQTYNNASSDPRNPLFNLDKYEPRPPIALTLRPVVTPGNNRELFAQQTATEKARSLPRPPLDSNRHLRQVVSGPMSGPNIYLRCLYGLRSGIPNEQDFALHHLVKVSYERGDKFKFEGFPSLAESLLEKALQITELVHGFKWAITYETIENMPKGGNVLNAAFGTPELWDHLQVLEPLDYLQGVTNAINDQKLSKLNEAALVLRNMTILEDNAAFITKMVLFREFLLIALNLPKLDELDEFRHYALEMAENTTKYWEMKPSNPLSLTLLNLVASEDRASIVTSLRAFNRIGMETPAAHDLSYVEETTIERVTSYALLDGDDELNSVAIDFLYQYTASTDNLKTVLRHNPSYCTQIIPRLTKFLTATAVSVKERLLVKAAQTLPRNDAIPDLPPFLYQQLVQMVEPDRASRWLRCVFEEAADADITQIAIWQAYQTTFRHAAPMQAPDFIKNVSLTFSTAQAQVINGPQPKFIIKGIRPRRLLHDFTGRPLIKCEWQKSNPAPYDLASQLQGRHLCNQWQQNRESLWAHTLTDHLNIRRNEQGTFRKGDSGEYICKWAACSRATMHRAQEAAQHMKLHIPESIDDAVRIAESAGVKEAEYTEHTWWNTAVDEKGHPCGLPYMSCLVLKNLARYALKQGQAVNESEPSTMDGYFGHVKPGLWNALTINRTLAGDLYDLMQIIYRGESFPGKGKGETVGGVDGASDA